jgi:hypothetical protein
MGQAMEKQEILYPGRGRECTLSSNLAFYIKEQEKESIS